MSSTNTIDKTDLSRRIIGSVEQADFDTLLSLFEDGAPIWHNFDETEVTLQDNIPLLRQLSATCKLSYEDVRIHETETGWIQFHLMRATYPDGSEHRVPACQVFTLGESGRVARFEEYLDSTQLFAVGTPPGADGSA
jgi:uncharacterized protein